MTNVIRPLPQPVSSAAPDLADHDTAQRLSRGLAPGIRMLAALDLNREQQAHLLGLSQRSLQRANSGRPPLLNQDQLTRLSLIVGMYKALHTLYDPATAARWLTRSSQRSPFGGLSPFAYMRTGGIPAMYEVRRLLDADCNGFFSVTPQALRAADELPTVLELGITLEPEDG